MSVRLHNSQERGKRDVGGRPSERRGRHPGEFASARQFAIEAFREAPTSYVSQFMYLRVAAEDFNAGRYADALAKVAELERAVPVSGLAPETWPLHFRADCQYVKGRCLKALGKTAEGQRLRAVPDLYQ